MGNDQLQLSHAQEAFALAETSIKAGSITNLDLLDAATAVLESKLLLLKSKIDYRLNVKNWKHLSVRGCINAEFMGGILDNFIPDRKTS